MDLITYNTNIYFFLVVSLLAWLLRVLYVIQIWFFFFFTELLVSFKYFALSSKWPRSCFILIYILFCIFLASSVNLSQFSLFFVLWCLKKTNSRYLEDIGGKGSLVKGFDTVCLYLPVAVVTSKSGMLVSLQVFTKFVYVVLLFVFFNYLV